MISWGISANSHDAALAVFKNKELLFASHSERFSGIKNDPHLDKNLLNYALHYGEPDEVHWYENPTKKSLRQLMQVKDGTFERITFDNILTGMEWIVMSVIIAIIAVTLLLVILPVALITLLFYVSMRLENLRR